MTKTVSNPFEGVWERQYIQIDEGLQESQQQVRWIQAAQYFVDVRSWPYLEPVTASTYVGPDGRKQFDAALLGFAGHFTWEKVNANQARCRWQHHITLLPGSFEDASDCTWLGADTLSEIGNYTDPAGVTHRFEERWQRLSSAAVQVLHRSKHCIALQCDDWVNIVCDRRTHPNDWAQYEATCWRLRQAQWQLQFGTGTSLSSELTLSPDMLPVEN